MTRPARKMKPSGIPWIGDVPTDWEICKLKFVVNAFTGNSIKDEEKDFYSSFPLESSHPYIATKDIDKITGRINYESGLRTLKRDTLFKLAPKYSTLLCVEGGSAGEKIAFTEQDVSFVNKLCCFYTSSINKKYLFYFLSSSAFKECFKSFISGLIGGVPVSVFKNFNISIPPTETQKKIAEFLDEKCAEIDALTAIEEKMIAELKSYKQSVITEAVTRGVPAAENAARPLKDSGIPWLGSVPAHWEVKQISRISSVVRGASPRPAGDPQYFHGDFIPWITVAEVTKDDGKFIFETETFLTEAGMRNSRIVNSETLLLSNSGATLGVPKITKIRGCINDGSVAFLNLTESKEFLFYVLKSRTQELRLQMQGSGQPNLNTQIVKSMYVPVPTREEQNEIVNYLDKKCLEIDSAISFKKEKITTLQNYKKSIIFEYTTGKKGI